MCFTKEVTAGMMAMNVCMGLYMHKNQRNWACTQVFCYFFLMELLQFIQHFVIDDCSNWVNQLTTVLSWVHICFQPLSVNVYIFRNEPNKDLRTTVARLCIVAGTLLSLRIPYLMLDYLPSWVFRLLPGLPNMALKGTDAVCSWETVCGAQTCTRMGKLHLQWSIPFSPPSYYFPSGFVHFLVFFFPATVAPGVWLWERRLMTGIAFLTGPFASQALSYLYTGGAGEWRLEWASTWCLYSAVLCVVLALGELVVASLPSAQARFNEQCLEAVYGIEKPADKPVVNVVAESKGKGKAQ